MYRVIVANLKPYPKHASDIDHRTIRRVGVYPTFEEACASAFQVCRANRGKPNAARKRYLVRKHGRCPRRHHWRDPAGEQDG